VTKLFDITTPAFGGYTVRQAVVDGQTWFCARDVIDALDLGVNATRLTQSYGVKEDETTVITSTAAKFHDVKLKTAYPSRGLTFVNAVAVRRIAQRSTKPAARAFQDFLNGTVAEAVETQGAYVHPALAQQNPDIGKMLAEMKTQLLAEMKQEFGGTVTTLTAKYETLVERQVKQEKTGLIDRMPLRSYCCTTGKSLSPKQTMYFGRALVRAHMKKFNAKPEKEEMVRDGRPKASLYPVDLLREVVDPLYANLLTKRAARISAAAAAP
jgi:prophage antirepressor-like protein